MVKTFLASVFAAVTVGIYGHKRSTLKGICKSVDIPPADQVTQPPRKGLVLFDTDGENFDKPDTIRILEESEKRGDKVYFLFIGVNENVHEFDFLIECGKRFKNTGFVHIADLTKFVKLSDEAINDILISDEFVQWLKD